MKATHILRIALYITLFILPIYGVSNCEGFSTANMNVTSCNVDTTFLRAYANVYTCLLVMSSFALFMPLLGYVIASFIGVELCIIIFKAWMVTVEEEKALARYSSSKH